MTEIEGNDSANINKSARGFRFNACAKATLIAALKKEKVNFMCTDGEVIPYVVDFATKKDIPILGYEAIYMGYNVKFMYLDSLKFEEEYVDKAGNIKG